MQINEKLSFETDVAVLFTFIMPNALHILGLTSWSTCCYMSINHFLGERKEELKTTVCAVFLQKQEVIFRQPRMTCDVSLLSLPCSVFSVMVASPECCWVGDSQMYHLKGSFLPKCSSASLQRVCVLLAPHLPLPTPSLTVCSTAHDLLGLGFVTVPGLPKNQLQRRCCALVDYL